MNTALCSLIYANTALPSSLIVVTVSFNQFVYTVVEDENAVLICAVSEENLERNVTVTVSTFNASSDSAIGMYV